MRRIARKWWPVLLPVFAVLAACDGGPEPHIGALRLIEQLGEVEVVASPDPMPNRGRRPAWTQLSRLVRPRDRQFFARVSLDPASDDAEERLAILIPAGTHLRFRVDLEGPATLRLGVGAPGGGDNAPPRALLRLTSGEESRTLVDRTLEDASWHPIAETAPGPGPLTIELEARGEPGSWVAWSSPELVGEPPPGWDLVMISLDTLRADRLGSYGYRRNPTSPHLDALADQAFRFATAVSSAPWTLPSHESLFSGVYPNSHGDLRPRPLAVALWHQGYRTEARTGGGVMDFRMGTLARGFDDYRIQDWIRDLDGLEASLAESEGRRRFLFLHTYEPHDPYIDSRFAADLPGGRVDGYFDKNAFERIRHTITDEEKAAVGALYDGDIAYTDEQIGELLKRLEASGWLERAILVITSDHGEQFWEHGSWRHGQNLYDEQLLVPLILKLPEALRRQHGIPTGRGVIEQQVRLVDLHPTLLELLDLPLQGPVHGRSLVPLLRGGELPEVEVLAEQPNVPDRPSKALRFRGFKLLRTAVRTPGEEDLFEELYDLRRDPGELDNLIGRRAEIAGELAAILERLVTGAWNQEEGALETDDLDPDLRRDLEALGYIGNQN